MVGQRDRLRDARRLAAVRRVLSLDDGDDEDLARISRLATALLDTPVSLVSLVDEDRQVFAAQTGMDGRWSEGTPLSHSMCRHVVDDDTPLVVSDARQDEDLRDHPALHDLDVVAYCGVPLRAPDGLVLGSFCVIDRDPRQWSDEEVALVEDLGAIAAAELARRVRADEAEDAVLAHDMRSSLRGVLGGFRTLVAAPDMQRTDRARFVAIVERHARHLEELLGRFLDGTSSLAEQAVPVDVRRVLGEVAAHLSDRQDIEVRDGEPVTALAVPAALWRCVESLAGSADGEAAVELGVTRSGDVAVVAVTVADGGDGPPHRSGRTGRGLDLASVRALARAMDGEAVLEPLDDGRSRYEIRLPVGVTPRP